MVYSTDLRTEDTTTSPRPPSGFLSEASLDQMERLLDSQFSIAGFRFGLDGLIGLVPVVGDVATAGVSSVIIADAWKKGVRKRTLGRMVMNTGVDMLIGSIPLVGDLLDFAVRSNVKNIRLMRTDLARQERATA